MGWVTRSSINLNIPSITNLLKSTLTILLLLLLLINDLYYLLSFFLVPPPNDISIAQSQPNTIYAGTVLQLNCMILLSDLINAPITVSSNWTKDGNAIISTNSRIFYNQTNVSLQTYSSNLFFIPLNSSDSGVYQCIIDVSGDEYVTPSAFKSLIDVTVEGKTIE